MPQRARDLSELDEVFLECRVLTHNWEPERTYITTHDKRTVLEIHLVCDRERKAGVLNPNRRVDYRARTGKARGKLIDRSMSYAPGYLLAPGTGHGRGTARTQAAAELVSRYVPTNGEGGKRKR